MVKLIYIIIFRQKISLKKLFCKGNNIIVFSENFPQHALLFVPTKCLLYCSIGSCFQQSTNQTKNGALTWKLIKTVIGTFDLFDLRTLILRWSMIFSESDLLIFDLWSHQTLWSEVIFDLLICGVHDLRPFCKSDLLILIFDLQSSELFDLSSQKTEPVVRYPNGTQNYFIVKYGSSAF